MVKIEVKTEKVKDTQILITCENEKQRDKFFSGISNAVKMLKMMT